MLRGLAQLRERLRDLLGTGRLGCHPFVDGLTALGVVVLDEAAGARPQRVHGPLGKREVMGQGIARGWGGRTRGYQVLLLISAVSC